LAPAADAPALTRARHRAALEEAKRELAEAAQQPEPELRAENLRLAARALGRVAGRVEVEEVLDRLFREFCIGK
jgi:tRNA modification GTPase